jgi:hypothetical protein
VDVLTLDVLLHREGLRTVFRCDVELHLPIGLSREGSFVAHRSPIPPLIF